MGLTDDDKFHTVHVYPKPDHYPEKREFFVEIQGSTNVFVLSCSNSPQNIKERKFCF